MAENNNKGVGGDLAAINHYKDILERGGSTASPEDAKRVAELMKILNRLPSQANTQGSTLDWRPLPNPAISQLLFEASVILTSSSPTGSDLQKLKNFMEILANINPDLYEKMREAIRLREKELEQAIAEMNDEKRRNILDINAEYDPNLMAKLLAEMLNPFHDPELREAFNRLDDLERECEKDPSPENMQKYLDEFDKAEKLIIKDKEIGLVYQAINKAPESISNLNKKLCAEVDKKRREAAAKVQASGASKDEIIKAGEKASNEFLKKHDELANKVQSCVAQAIRDKKDIEASNVVKLKKEIESLHGPDGGINFGDYIKHAVGAYFLKEAAKEVVNEGVNKVAKDGVNEGVGKDGVNEGVGKDGVVKEVVKEVAQNHLVEASVNLPLVSKYVDINEIKREVATASKEMKPEEIKVATSSASELLGGNKGAKLSVAIRKKNKTRSIDSMKTVKTERKIEATNISRTI